MKRHRSYSRFKTAIRSFGNCLQNKSDSGCKLLGFSIAEANYQDPRRLGLWFLLPLTQVRCFHIMSLCHAFQLHVHWEKKKTLGRLDLSKLAVHWEMNHHWESYQHGHKLQLNIINCKLKLMKKREKLKRQLLTTSIFCSPTFWVTIWKNILCHHVQKSVTNAEL